MSADLQKIEFHPLQQRPACLGHPVGITRLGLTTALGLTLGSGSADLAVKLYTRDHTRSRYSNNSRISATDELDESDRHWDGSPTAARRDGWPAGVACYIQRLWPDYLIMDHHA